MFPRKRTVCDKMWADFTINVIHRTGKLTAHTDYLSKNPTASKETSSKLFYSTETVFPNTVALATTPTIYEKERKNVSTNQTTNDGQWTCVKEQLAIDCLSKAAFILVNLKSSNNSTRKTATMDARLIDNF